MMKPTWHVSPPRSSAGRIEIRLVAETLFLTGDLSIESAAGAAKALRAAVAAIRAGVEFQKFYCGDISIQGEAKRRISLHCNGTTDSRQYGHIGWIVDINIATALKLADDLEAAIGATPADQTKAAA